MFPARNNEFGGKSLDTTKWNVLIRETSKHNELYYYLILNTAVGGGWPGNPDSSTVFPQYHDIDYVRIYS